MSDFDVIREALDYADHALPVPAHESAVAALSRVETELAEANQKASVAVEMGQGWYADLLAAEAERDALLLGMELAWGLIANADSGNWSDLDCEWTHAAIKWRDEHWHTALDRRAALADKERT